VLGAALAATAAFAAVSHRTAPSPASSMAGMAMPIAYQRPPAVATLPAAALSQARLATARFANDLGAAKKSGYQILTRQMPGMGYHFINPKVTGFDVKKPPILVYERHGSSWQLGALEWVFPSKPAKAPLAGARYGSFPAACHYLDGTWVTAPSADACAKTSPSSGSKLNFWHPRLVTMHVWLWYPNPSGLFSSTNPLVQAFS
jgi:hypothetical protein